ncbi:MAG: hypothetical protein GX561_00755 [Lentisphaerae bacterium]|jgi:hypothetical protein|nr:hypothetical protein [Lentisphaerota bacterium]
MKRLITLFVFSVCIFSFGQKIAIDSHAFDNASLKWLVEAANDLEVNQLAISDNQLLCEETGSTLNALQDDAKLQELAKKLSADNANIACLKPTKIDGKQDWMRTISLAKALKAKTIIIDTIPQNCDELAAQLRKAGLKLAVVSTSCGKEFSALPREIGVCLDVFAMAKAGVDICPRIRYIDKNRIAAVLLKPSGEGAILGADGSLTVQKTVGALRRIGWKETIIVSQVPGDYGSLRQSLIFLNACMKARCPKTVTYPIYVGNAVDVAQLISPKLGTNWERAKPADVSMYKDAMAGVNGTITASHPGHPNETIEKLIDRDTKTKYCVKYATPTIQYAFPQGVKPTIVAYAFITANDAESRDPKQWKLFGSNDGENWTEIDKQANQSWPERFFRKAFKLKAPAAYSHYKLIIEQNHGDLNFQVSEFELFEKK